MPESLQEVLPEFDQTVSEAMHRTGSRTDCPADEVIEQKRSAHTMSANLSIPESEDGDGLLAPRDGAYWNDWHRDCVQPREDDT